MKIWVRALAALTAALLLAGCCCIPIPLPLPIPVPGNPPPGNTPPAQTAPVIPAAGPAP